MIPAPTDLHLSGERFTVTYRLTGGEAEASAKAKDICLEQTVEFPGDLVPEGPIRDHILGQIDSFEMVDRNKYEAVISYAVEVVGAELPQLVNVIFGNSSLKPGICVERFDLPESLLRSFRGPRFGRSGLREYLHVPERPLLCTALKPLGLSPTALANLAYRFAQGGIDIIKDDHGLADQPFCRFEERVQCCAAAVRKANRETGLNCIYMPNITAPGLQVLDRALFAKRAGAGGLLICPGLTGRDVMCRIADEDRVALPIMSHPAFYGSFTISPDNGVSHFALYGQLMRVSGADASIFPNYGGRFSFTREECAHIAAGAAVEMGPVRPSFPTPGGGMSLDRLTDMRTVYGREVIYLIGGGLHKHGPDLVDNCRHFLALVRQKTL